MLWTLRLEDGQFCLLRNGAELKRRPRERLGVNGATVVAAPIAPDRAPGPHFPPLATADPQPMAA